MERLVVLQAGKGLLKLLPGLVQGESRLQDWFQVGGATGNWRGRQ
jgi:hypothetical protein